MAQSAFTITSSPPFSDAAALVSNNSDATKLLILSAASISTATTRTLTAPDASGTLALTSNNLSVFAATTSAQLAGVISDETGTGVLVFGTTPSFTTSMLLSSGFVMNWNASNVVLTHSSGLLTLGTGDLRITTAGTNAASVVTVGGTQTLTNKTLTSPTLTTPALGTPASGVATNLTSIPAANLLIASQAIGDTLYASSTTVWSRLGIGSTGNVLTVAGGVPTWAPPSGGGSFSSTGGVSGGPATSSTQTITHGLGRTPVIIRLHGYGAVSGSTSSSTGGSTSGVWNASGNNCVYVPSTFNAGATGVTTSSVFAIFLSNGGSSPNTGNGVVGNVTSTTFDIVWTITGTLAPGNTSFMWESQ